MIKFVDMFSGIGGFREGLTRAGGFECVGHCEIDKYANRSYNALFDTKGEWFIEDARKADPSTMPDFQLLCGGFPCQSFSVAGARRGFSDPRGTLFFEIARLVEARHPAYLILENVPGLLNHSRGETYATILNTLDRLGYGVEWQFYHGTIEWRLFNSTLHAGEAKANIILAMAISAQGINQKYTQFRKTPIGDNPAFTFRTFLLRLGLIGPEYKNVRMHLLKNLPGDKAWRHDKSLYPSNQPRLHTDEVR